jgi:drug/metabolite transporter (DMT)-like permease
MTLLKLLTILIVGLIFESIGVVLLKKGMNQMGEITQVNVPEVLRMVKSGVTNPSILLGIFFEALFFGCLLILMSRSQITFLWPLTALSFVFSTFAAMWFLQEKVSGVRWAGVVCIMIGAALISYSEHIRPKEEPAPPASSAAPGK